MRGWRQRSLEPMSVSPPPLPVSLFGPSLLEKHRAALEKRWELEFGSVVQTYSDDLPLAYNLWDRDSLIAHFKRNLESLTELESARQDIQLLLRALEQISKSSIFSVQDSFEGVLKFLESDSRHWLKACLFIDSFFERYGESKNTKVTALFDSIKNLYEISRSRYLIAEGLKLTWSVFCAHPTTTKQLIDAYQQSLKGIKLLSDYVSEALQSPENYFLDISLDFMHKYALIHKRFHFNDCWLKDFNFNGVKEEKLKRCIRGINSSAVIILRELYKREKYVIDDSGDEVIYYHPDSSEAEAVEDRNWEILIDELIEQHSPLLDELAKL